MGYDYEATTKLFPNNRTGNLLVHQGHAFDHFARRCTNRRGAIPNPPDHRDLACPICGVVKGMNKFSQEHCPQRNGTSSFGGPQCVVMTCTDCNNSASRYESKAAEVQLGSSPNKGNVAMMSERPSGLITIDGFEDEAVIAADLKTAFLVAFAALGYRFAFSSGLRPVRRSILNGSSSDSAGPIEPDDAKQSGDLKVREHSKGWVFVSGIGHTWSLPIRRGVAAPTAGRARTMSWPTTHTSGNHLEVSSHVGAGNFFHSDFCTDAKHDGAYDADHTADDWSP